MAAQYAYYMQRERLTKPTTSIRLSAEQLRDVDELVRRTGMKSRTELIERAIERYIEDLKGSKVLVLREWTPTKAKAAVVKFLKNRPSAYVSDIIEALGMDPDLAFRTVDTLLREGAVDRAA